MLDGFHRGVHHPARPFVRSAQLGCLGLLGVVPRGLLLLLYTAVMSGAARSRSFDNKKLPTWTLCASTTLVPLVILAFWDGHFIPSPFFTLIETRATNF